MKVETDEIEIEEWKPKLPFLKINSDKCRITEENSKSDTSSKPFVKIKTEQQKCDICDNYYENLETHFANSHIKNEVQEGLSFYKYQNLTNFNVKKESNERKNCDSNSEIFEENNIREKQSKLIYCEKTQATNIRFINMLQNRVQCVSPQQAIFPLDRNSQEITDFSLNERQLDFKILWGLSGTKMVIFI